LPAKAEHRRLLPMADQQQPAKDESSPFVEVARKRITAGELLPAPKSWEEYWAGAIAWITLRWQRDGNYECGQCGSNDIELGQVVGLVSDSRWPSAPGVGHGSFPYIQVECPQCGHMRLLDALKVFEPQQPWRP
jgi:DNA-directed RNA polymerase subunit RPC12/RpoP